MRRRFLFGAFMPVLVLAQSIDTSHLPIDRSHLLVDAEADGSSPHTYRTLQEAVAHMPDTATIYFAPSVYWIDDPDDPAVRTGNDGHEPFGMVIRAKKLHFIGLGDRPDDVVLASQRGQTQGAVGNFTMFDFWVGALQVENLTMGNYCNVDLVYPRNPKLNRPKRNEAITQAHVGYVHGDTLEARRVRFISRLNLNPLNGARHSYYEDCHFECTDDALNGTATYRHCDFDLYGQKPFWSTRGAGALFIDCDFNVMSDNREMYFCKQGGPVTVINSRYHAPSDSLYIGWTAYPQPWLRCYQHNFTLNGRPYLIGHHQPQNTIVLPAHSPALRNVLETQLPPFLDLSQHEATIETGRDTLSLQTATATILVIPANNSDEIDRFCLTATNDDGREAASHLTVMPSKLPPPTFLRHPAIIVHNGVATIDYELDLQGRRDESRITWYRNGIAISTSHRTPERTYLLTEADKGGLLTVTIEPKHQRSKYGNIAIASVEITKAPKMTALDTDFHDFPVQWQQEVLPGYWTVDGYKPLDTAEYPWDFDRTKLMWKYGEGYNGAVGRGLLQEQRGARLMYTPVKRKYGNMHLTLDVDPTKTAGQGFGSATGQYMDVCLKFDTHTLTGYGLRIIRTTKHAKAVDFLLVRYDQGTVTPISQPVSSTCYRTGCTISLDFIGKRLTAHVETRTPQPAGSTLPHMVDLTATVEPNAFGGIHIQHTGSSGGESTTMLHRLHAEWK